MAGEQMLQRIDRALAHGRPRPVPGTPSGTPPTPVAVATIVRIWGEVRVVPRLGAPRSAAVGMSVYRGESVVTVQNSPHCNVTLGFPDGTEMFLCENAFVHFRQ